jgi:hypothetical protein
MTPEIFIGYKNAGEIFEQYELYNNRQSMGCQTNDAIREVSSIHAFLRKKRKKITDLLIHYGNLYKIGIILIVGSKFR